MRVGASAHDGGVEFRVWAPDRASVEVVVTAPNPARYPLHPEAQGYHSAFVADLGPGTRYRYAIGDALLPDPASRAQPDGVHGDSAVIASGYEWSAPGWVGHALSEYVISEVHIGAFTEAGTFDAAIDRLDDLRDLGITAIEIMPVAAFPGVRNWGYDGVFPFAAQASYGGADGLRRLVDACHQRGLSAVLDVVYNHLGPEGNVLGEFGPYFTNRYATPWGDALNFDGSGADEVRNFFVENALQWVADFRFDALRLDAVDAIADPSAYPFVEQLIDAVHAYAEQAGRHIWVIAETAANDSRLITAKAHGGMGCDAQWNDDFHHALHALVTGERDHYYEDFGAIADLATAYRDGYVYAGRYSPFRGHRYGRSAAGLPGQRFVVFAQNHDQIGNRAIGDRLATIVDADRVRLAAAAALLGPFLPLLFMGEEYGETQPFPYFVDHGEPALIEAVRKGRRAEFADFHERAEPPDPAAPATFESARLRWSRRDEPPHAAILDWYRRLLELRRTRPALQALEPSAVQTQVFEREQVLVVTRAVRGDAVVLVFGFGPENCELEVAVAPGTWEVLLDSHGDTRAIERVGVYESPSRLVVPASSTLVLGAETIA